MKGEPTSHAECATDIMYGGNHTCGSGRPLLQGAVYAGFLGTIAKLKRLVLYFLCIYQPALPSGLLIHSLLAVALGKHLTQRKTLGREENRKREAFTSKERATPIQNDTFTNEARFEIHCTAGTCLSHKVTGTLSFSMVCGIYPFHNFRMNPGTYFCLLDWLRVREWSYFGPFVS